MNKTTKYVLPILLWISSSCILFAENVFSSAYLKETAVNIGLNHLDSLKTGNNSIVLGKDTIVIRKNEDGVIDHIGKPLFPMVARQKNPLPIYDYMEYVYLNYLFNKKGNRLIFEDVTFQTGNWEDFASVSPDNLCNISNIDNKIYKLSWEKNGKNLITVIIPIRYDVLSIMSRTEMQNAFIHGEKKMVVDCNREVQLADTTQLSKTSVGHTDIWYYSGNSYLNKKITDNYYLLRKDSLMIPIIDKNMPAESIANILILSSSKSVGNYPAHIRYLLSNNQTLEQETTIRQIIDYAQTQGCKPYCGIEGIKDGRVHFSLFLYNENSGYDHIFRLSCQTDQIGSDTLTFTGKGSLFAPTTNVKSLFSNKEK